MKTLPQDFGEKDPFPGLSITLSKYQVCVAVVGILEGLPKGNENREQTVEITFYNNVLFLIRRREPEND